MQCDILIDLVADRIRYAISTGECALMIIPAIGDETFGGHWHQGCPASHAFVVSEQLHGAFGRLELTMPVPTNMAT